MKKYFFLLIVIVISSCIHKEKQAFLRDPNCQTIVFNPDTVSDMATFVNPKQFAVGIDYVFVNGKLTVNEGKHTGMLNGKVLRTS